MASLGTTVETTTKLEDLSRAIHPALQEISFGPIDNTDAAPDLTEGNLLYWLFNTGPRPLILDHLEYIFDTDETVTSESVGNFDLFYTTHKGASDNAPISDPSIVSTAVDPATAGNRVVIASDLNADSGDHVLTTLNGQLSGDDLDKAPVIPPYSVVGILFDATAGDFLGLKGVALGRRTRTP